MNVDTLSLGKHLTSLAWVAFRSFVGTLCLATLGGVVLAGLSCYFLREHPWFYGVLAAALALGESVTAGCVLGAKRAVMSAVAHGLGTLRLGRSFVRLIFERMAGGAEGEASGRIARGLERLPFAQAEALLSRAVRNVMGDAEQGGWLRRRIRTHLLEHVRKFTLARFREEGAQQGGIDLLKVKEELELTADDALVQKVRGGLQLATALVIIGLPVVVAVQTWAINRLL